MGTPPETITIPPSWKRRADLILRRRFRKVFLLGAPDRGKSTFAAYLTARLLEAGERVAYLDADPGQKLLGPPTTLGLGFPQAGRPLSETEPRALYFVGDVSPRGNLLPMVVGMVRLAKRADKVPFLVINTCGYVQEAGEVLKSYEIEALSPDLIVALQKGEELSPLLLAFRHFPILRLESPPQVRRRSLEERRQNRLRAFRRHFRAARSFAVPLRRLILQRLFDPQRNQDPLGNAPTGAKEAGQRKSKTEEALSRGRICALCNLQQEVLGLALIERFEARAGLLWLRSATRIPEVAVLQIGRLGLPELLAPSLQEA